MTLSEAQRLFTAYLPRLIDYAYEHGYELTLGEAYRTLEQAQWDVEHGTGVLNSLHCDRLAIDLNVWRNGRYSDDVDDYRPLGEFWKALRPEFRWGGDFSTVDADHFSMTFEGRE